MSLLNLYKDLFYNRYEVKIRATNDVVFDAWSGAIIRNNLLFAADQIKIQKTGRSLREQIDTIPLPKTHPLYKELKDGFPKGYVLTDFSHFDSSVPCGAIMKEEELSFALLLIGRLNDYRFYFFEAIREMCERGLGKPITPFQLIDISESRFSPVIFSDYKKADTVDYFSMLTIRFLTPTILNRLKGKKNAQLSYQDKTNRFPSLYQLTRSLLSRMQKLYALFIAPSDCSSLLFDEEMMEAYLEKAGLPLLKAANIVYKILPNTRKKEKKNEMPLTGYIGEQTYSGYFEQYLPLLKFMSGLGVGNDTVYGLGRFEVSEHFAKNRINEKQIEEVENEVKTLENNLSLTFIEGEGSDSPTSSLTAVGEGRFLLRQLIIRFKNRIRHDDIPFLIEAIVRNAMINNDELFHRFILSGTRYCYPFIQFKQMYGRFAFICIGEGTERIDGFFSSAGEPVIVNDKKIVLEIEDVKAERVLIQVWENNFTYSIQNYLPMNEDKYIEYQTITEQSERIEWMRDILKSNLLFFTESIGIIQFEREVICEVTELEEKAKVKYKNHPFTSFDLIFRTNISLPDYIGLGIGVSHGFGTIKRIVSQ